MSHLVISLLGPMQVVMDGRPVETFESNRVRALLAYLCTEAAQPHHRQKLATLLWPEWPDAAARKNLRSALPNLRKSIGDYQATPPFLHISRETIQFNAASSYCLDVEMLLTSAKATSAAKIQQLESTVALYKGEFMEGFSLADSPPFEEWLLRQREHLHQQALTTLQHITNHYEQVGDTLRACEFAQRQITLDSFCEEAHRQLMRLLATRGETSSALAHFEQFEKLITDELSAQPAPETIALYVQIKAGTFVAASSDAIQLRPAAKNRVKVPQPQAQTLPLPPYLTEQRPSYGANEMPFVARQTELAQLSAHLESALAGQGRIVFIEGDAGSGKSRLLREFRHLMAEAHSNLLVSGGACTAHTGDGDPYLPFRESIGLLTGDLEATWLAGELSHDLALQLWETLPRTIQHLVKEGPALIDSIVRGESLLERLSPGLIETPWLEELRTTVEEKHQSVGRGKLQQNDLFEQATAFLQAIAAQQPLLLTLDDLQWADAGSLNLLFHLGRHLGGYPILIVGTYRPEEVAAGRNNERHPLQPLLHEFGRMWGARPIDLNDADGRQFVDSLIDHRLNRLDAEFREMLFQRSAGHALFTTELLEEMQQRGDLIQDKHGYWIEADSLNWEATPARVDAIIMERISRLPSALRQALSIASVEGETFAAEIVAQLLNMDDRELIGLLSRELDRKHYLIQVQGIQQVNGQRLSLYRFRHILFQEYLYGTLDEAERIYWHDEMGRALESCYTDLVGSNISYATQLARHFQLAEDFGKAVRYFTCAGHRATELFANEEAVCHFTDALSLLKGLPKSQGRDRQELQIEVDLSIALGIVYGHAAPTVESHLVRTAELAEELGNASQMFLSAWRLWQYYHVQGDLYSAQSRAQRLMDHAERTQDRTQCLAACQAIGNTAFAMGKLSDTHFHLIKSIELQLSPKEESNYILTFGTHPAVLTRIFLGLAECCRGYPDLAVRYVEEALLLAEQAEHPFSISFALIATCGVHGLRRDATKALDYATKAIIYCREYGIIQWIPWSIYTRGCALATLHNSIEGLEEAKRGFSAWRKSGSDLWSVRMRTVLADACLQVGHIDCADKLLAEAIEYVDSTGERLYEAELYRLKGVLLHARRHSLDNEHLAETERYFLKAIAIAQQQHAKFWELRATISLSQCYIEAGIPDEAQQRLTAIYDWFTEGFDLPDLREAKELLAQISARTSENGPLH